jgi:hypothetical protein
MPHYLNWYLLMLCVACFEHPLWLWACLVFGLCFAPFHLGVESSFCFFFSELLLASWLWLRGSLAFQWEFGFKSLPWLLVAFCDLSIGILSMVLN